MISSTSDLLTVLGIAIALSAYLSAIRIGAIQKIADLPNDTDGKARRWELKKKLGLLTFADVPMVLSAFFLGTYVLWGRLFCGAAPVWLVVIGLWAFFAGGFAMVVLHGAAWMKTVSELIQGKK